MDKTASTAAREQGNALFRKGKWRDAAAAYARAAELDPSDAAPWSNAAMAWLKLEQWDEAILAASQALSRDPGNVKAAYRRALGYRALGNLDAARADLEDVLSRDPNNSAAATEKGEVEAALEREREAALAKEKLATQSDVEKSEKEKLAAMRNEELEKERQEQEAAKIAATPASREPSGFAALRKSRDARPSYAAREPPSASSTTALRQSTSNPVAAPTTLTAPEDPVTLTVPENPDSTAPGAGLALLRALTPHSPLNRWTYLRHYSPETIAQITAPVLEPDTLGVLLSAIDGVSDPSEADKTWALQTLQALKATRRWRMNFAMLSSSERAAGEHAWAAAGGEGRL